MPGGGTKWCLGVDVLPGGGTKWCLEVAQNVVWGWMYLAENFFNDGFKSFLKFKCRGCIWRRTPTHLAISGSGCPPPTSPSVHVWMRFFWTFAFAICISEVFLNVAFAICICEVLKWLYRRVTCVFILFCKYCIYHSIRHATVISAQ